MSAWPRFDYYHIRRGLFSPKECLDLVAASNELVGTSGHLPGAREAKIFWLHRADREWLFDRLADFSAGWNSTYGVDLAATQHGAVQMSRYDPGDRYDWHMDIGHGPMSLRRATIVVELAHALEGGGLEIFYGHDRPNRLPLMPGDAVIFWSFIMHRALPVHCGSRWSLAQWLLGAEPWR